MGNKFKKKEKLSQSYFNGYSAETLAKPLLNFINRFFS